MANQIDEDKVIAVDTYNGMYLEQHEGNYSLKAIQIGKNEVPYLIWVFLSKWSKAAGGAVPDDKKRPMAVRLGTRSEAVKALKQILKQIEEG